MSTNIPADAPPSYADATGSSSSSRPAAHNDSSRLQVPGASSANGKGSIPSAHRRSMEDEQRPLPSGWVRTYDPTSHHQFFVDTTQDPPRSIWVHPYDDDTYLATLTTDERERIESESMHRGKHPSHADIIAAHSEDEEEDHRNDTQAATSHASSSSSSSSSTTATSYIPPELPPREGKGKGKGNDDRSFGRKFKDKVTGTSHEDRAATRARRAEEERRAYEQHVRIRQAMSEAMQTGRPVLVGKDREGKDVYVEPPRQQPYGGVGGGGYGPYGGGGYGYNPYGGGVYSTPSARYIRPQAPYGRPYGGGFGGGYGLPLALGGGLLGGMLLGDMFAGGF